MDLFDIYLALWARARSAGACVHYFDQPLADPPSLHGDQTGASGWFLANADIADAQPVIQIYRLEYDDALTPSRSRRHGGGSLPTPDLEYELITLAHEYGHLMSYRGRTQRADWDLYTASARRRGDIAERVIAEMPTGLAPSAANELLRLSLYEGLGERDRSRIVAEESLAWRIGREALSELGHVDFQQFDRREADGLHAHRYWLGLDDVWPGDEGGIPSE